MNHALSVPLDVKLMNLTAHVLLLGFLLLALGTTGGWILRHPVFAIRGLSVLGDVTHNSAATLRAYVMPHLSGTFLTVDLDATRQAFEAVPWVRHAVVRREFPNRLKVILQEHQAVAYWGDEGDSTLVNSYGEVFEANLGEVDQEWLPRLGGPKEQSAQVLELYRALEPMFDAMELPIAELDLTASGSWHARLDSGAAIQLGRGSEAEVAARTRQFLSTITQVASRYGRNAGSLESADLRYEQGYAIRLRGVSTVASREQGQKKQ